MMAGHARTIPKGPTVKNITRLILVVAAGIATAADTSAHFKMLAPTPWVVTNDLGDPQKVGPCGGDPKGGHELDRKSTRLNSSHSQISYAVFCLKKKKKKE